MLLASHLPRRLLHATSPARRLLNPPRPLDRGALPAFVRVVEVGPRDGLQNEKAALDVATKAALVARLLAAGLQSVEAGSMVSKQWVPQMADSGDVLRARPPRVGGAGGAGPAPRLSVLTPNMKGFEAALAAGADEVAVFAAATDAFSLRNINCGVLDSLQRFRPVMAAAQAAGLPVRGYVSCAVGCPYSGAVAPAAVGHVAAELLAMGCYEVSLGDTIGVGTPRSVKRMLLGVVAECGVDVSRLALHAHDTYGMGLANVLAALEEGVAAFDSSVAGLGGCPYAGGAASGNIATEDLLYLLHGLGLRTGVDADAVVDAAEFITRALGVQSRSRAGAARGARRRALAEAEAAAAAAPAGADGDKARAKAEGAAAAARLALSSWPEPPDVPWPAERDAAEAMREAYVQNHALEREPAAAARLGASSVLRHGAAAPAAAPAAS